jgi:asparagine synthase (glutamine-hydrolysing)
MSGVFGYLENDGATSALRCAQDMAARMRHHPYYVTDVGSPCERVALGRVSIGRLNSAPQPLCSHDGAVWLCLTGEFYHQSARRAALVEAGAIDASADDATFALQIYLREGAHGLTQLDGAFTLAVWDDRREELLIVNDRYGLYPHYYAYTTRGFAFAPEVKGALRAPGLARRIDQAALAEYVRFQQFLGDKTWFEDVRMLPPASLLRYSWRDNRLTLSRYWDWSQIGSPIRISFDEAVEEAIRLFQRAINAMTAPPLKPGVYLSGGLDGRIILGFMDHLAPVTTISFGAADCRDVVYSAQLARRAGAHHHWFPLKDGHWVRENAPLHLALNEGMHSWMHAHGITTLATARNLIDVNLSGWDGATTLGGVAVLDDPIADRFYRHAPDELTLAQRLYDAFCRHLSWPGLTEAEAAPLADWAGANLCHTPFETLRYELTRTAHYPADRRVDYFIIEQMLRRSLQNQIIFARSAIDVRCPYFDYDLVTFMYTLPDTIRTDPAFRRAIVTRRMPQLAQVPYDKDNLLPHSNRVVRGSHALMQRAKGFVNRRVARVFPEHTTLYANYEHYLRTDLREWAEQILFDNRTLERSLFNQDVVRSLWERHLSGKELWTIGKIAPLITIELTMRYLYDETPHAEFVMV